MGEFGARVVAGLVTAFIVALIRVGVNRMPNVAWDLWGTLWPVLGGATVFLVCWAVQLIRNKFRDVEEKLSGIEGAGLKVVSRGADGVVSIRLGEREFDFGPGAYEYYEEQKESDREKILRRLRRHVAILSLRLNKEDFEMLIDEKRRVHLKLNQYLKQARGIKEKIESERDRRAREPQHTYFFEHARELLAGIPLPPPLPDYELNRLTGEVGNWQREVYEFLQNEVKGYAEEFNLSVPPLSQQTDPLSLLLHFVDEYVGRLISIKSRQP